MFYLLDTYLNTPDKFLNETPLHFASKFGTPDILELFLSFPECDRDRKNTKGETPFDVILSKHYCKIKSEDVTFYCFYTQIICSSCKNPSSELVDQMKLLFSQRYFVPLLRPTDFSSPALVGKPWSPDVTPQSPEALVSISVTSPLVCLSAI